MPRKRPQSPLASIKARMIDGDRVRIDIGLELTTEEVFLALRLLPKIDEFTKDPRNRRLARRVFDAVYKGVQRADNAEQDYRELNIPHG